MCFRVTVLASSFLLALTINTRAQYDPRPVATEAGKPPVYESAVYSTQVKTYVNPVLGGDHPDPILLKVGDDFFVCGSTFHFTPYLPILHSKDRVHWQELSCVVPPEWNELKTDSPGGGIWQDAVTNFYGFWWIYFSNGNSGAQYFSKTLSSKGPWTTPEKVKTTSTTGPVGYDNSIFADDDGTAYMLTEAGKPVNRIQKIGRDSHLPVCFEEVNEKTRFQ